jgi:hypothetical protein
LIQSQQSSEEMLTSKVPQLRVSSGPGLFQNFRRAQAMQVFDSMSPIRIVRSIGTGLQDLWLMTGD